MTEPQKEVAEKIDLSFLHRQEPTPPSEIAEKAKSDVKVQFMNLGAAGARNLEPSALESIFTDKRNREPGEFSDGFDFEFDGNGKPTKVLISEDDIRDEAAREILAENFVDNFFATKKKEYGDAGPTVSPEDEAAMNSDKPLEEGSDL